MDLHLLTWNGNAINDGDSYATYIPPESRFDLTSNPNYQDRAENFPFLSGSVLPAHAFVFKVTIVPTDTWTQDLLREQLKEWFSVLDFQPHALVAEDWADNKKQYQLVGLPARLTPSKEEGDGYVTFMITIAVMEPVWQAVTLTSNTWAITGTGQTKTIAVAGGTYSRPKLTIQPTTARTGQFQYSRWCKIINRATVPHVIYSIDVTDGGINTATLVADVSKSNQINQGGGINAVVTTIPIDTAVGGGLPSVGWGYVDTEQISWTANSGTSLTGVTRGIGGTTAAVHADNAVIKNSKMLADGSDIAVQVDGALVNAWVDGANTTVTKIWIAQTWQTGRAGTLRTALPNNSTAVTVEFTKNPTNLTLLQTLKQSRNNTFMVENEAFTYSPANIDLTAYKITSCSRAQKFTSAASHAIGVAITWVEHDVWLLYGNSAGSPLTRDDTQKPLLNLNTSTNTSWVFANFFDTISTRPAQWNGGVIQSVGQQSLVYTGNQTALANPSTELGMSLIDYVQANIWKAETAQIAWAFYHPSGITTVSISGSKRLISGTAWPTIAGLQKSSNGLQWLTVWTEVKPTVLNTWQSWTHTAQSLSGTFNNIRLALIGTIAVGASNEADLQGDTVTLTLDNTKTPTVVLGSENNIYYLNLQITNNRTGDYIILNWTMALNRILTVDTDKKTVTYDDGSNAISALTLSTTRNDWLPLQPGNNILQVDDTGIANITIQVTHYNRNW